MLLSGIKYDGTTDVLKQFCVKFICNWYEMVASETYPSHYSIFKESAADADPLPNRFTISLFISIDVVVCDVFLWKKKLDNACALTIS